MTPAMLKTLVMELQQQHKLTPSTDVPARHAAMLSQLRKMVEEHADTEDDMTAIINELPSMPSIAAQAVAFVLLDRLNRLLNEALQAGWERDLYE